MEANGRTKPVFSYNVRLYKGLVDDSWTQAWLIPLLTAVVPLLYAEYSFWKAHKLPFVACAKCVGTGDDGCSAYYDEGGEHNYTEIPMKVCSDLNGGNTQGQVLAVWDANIWLAIGILLRLLVTIAAMTVTLVQCKKMAFICCKTLAFGVYIDGMRKASVPLLIGAFGSTFGYASGSLTLDTVLISLSEMKPLHCTDDGTCTYAQLKSEGMGDWMVLVAVLLQFSAYMSFVFAHFWDIFAVVSFKRLFLCADYSAVFQSLGHVRWTVDGRAFFKATREPPHSFCRPLKLLKLSDDAFEAFLVKMWENGTCYRLEGPTRNPMLHGLTGGTRMMSLSGIESPGEQ